MSSQVAAAAAATLAPSSHAPQPQELDDAAVQSSYNNYMQRRKKQQQQNQHNQQQHSQQESAATTSSLGQVVLTRIAFLNDILPFLTDSLDEMRQRYLLVHSSWRDCLANYAIAFWSRWANRWISCVAHCDSHGHPKKGLEALRLLMRGRRRETVVFAGSPSFSPQANNGLEVRTDVLASPEELAAAPWWILSGLARGLVQREIMPKKQIADVSSTLSANRHTNLLLTAIANNVPHALVALLDGGMPPMATGTVNAVSGWGVATPIATVSPLVYALGLGRVLMVDVLLSHIKEIGENDLSKMRSIVDAKCAGGVTAVAWLCGPCSQWAAFAPAVNADGGTRTIPTNNRLAHSSREADALRLQFLKKLVEECGASIENTGQSSALHVACSAASNEGIAEYLLARNPLLLASTVSQTSATPLHFAAKNNEDFTLLRLLVARGANVNARDQTQRTPLMAACAAQAHRCVAELLCAPGIDVSAVDASGNTALHVSVIKANAQNSSSSLSVVQQLFRIAPQLAVVANARSQTCVDLAAGNKTLLSILLPEVDKKE